MSLPAAEMRIGTVDASRMGDACGERFRPPALLKQRAAAGYSGARGKRGWLANA